MKRIIEFQIKIEIMIEKYVRNMTIIQSNDGILSLSLSRELNFSTENVMLNRNQEFLMNSFKGFPIVLLNRVWITQ